VETLSDSGRNSSTRVGDYKLNRLYSPASQVFTIPLGKGHQKTYQAPPTSDAK